MDIEGGQVGPRAATDVFVLDAHGHARLGRQRRVYASRAWMLVFSSVDRTNSSPAAAVPASAAHTDEDAPRLDRELRSRERSSSDAATADRIGIEPTPDRAVANGGDQPELPCRLGHVATLKRDRGAPSVAGNSHASALTCTTTAGGKARPAWARLIFQPSQTFLEEALAPQAHIFAPSMQGRRISSLLQPSAASRIIWPEPPEIRQRIFGGTTGQLAASSRDSTIRNGLLLGMAHLRTRQHAISSRDWQHNYTCVYL